MYDLIIIGAGPAGCAASVYAARKRVRTLLITEEFGGQSIVSEGIENWIGTTRISGMALKNALESHVRNYEGRDLTIITNERVGALSGSSGAFSVTTESGKNFMSKTVLVASGASRKQLTIPGADTFEHKGVVYCASCDGPLFSDQDLVVIGGGNAGFETAAQLLAYAKSVTLIHRGTDFKADPITVEKVLAHKNMRAHANTTPLAVLGDAFVSGLRIKDNETGEERDLQVTGVFVEIGVNPNTDFAKDILMLDDVGRIVTNPRSQQASLKDGAAGISGVWAAGDVTDELYHQNNIAAGDGVKALEDLYQFLKRM